MNRLPRAALLLAVFWVSVAQTCWSQTLSDPLPRRGWFGVALGANDDGGVTVTSVQPGSTAAEMGIEAGDIVRTVDGVAMRTPADVVAAIGHTHRAGDRVTLGIARDSHERNVAATLRPFPLERVPGSDVEYGSVVLESGVRLRTIITVPKGVSKSAPAVFVLQGGGCSSVDQPLAMPIGTVQTIHAVAAAGFVTLRVDKSGVGDSEGPPCATIGYREELDGYRAALQALRAHAAVDRDRIFLVGISLGGVFAPILANETRVAGISAWGTLAFAPGRYPGRSERFFAEFAIVDVLAHWAKIDVPVQVLRGEYDEVSMREWSEMIVETINATHRGRVEYREFPGLDHCSTRHATREDSVGRCGAGEFVAEPDDAIVAFLNAHS
jgi:pimeloyl-ACP methyl ester carboxylesterase